MGAVEQVNIALILLALVVSVVRLDPTKQAILLLRRVVLNVAQAVTPLQLAQLPVPRVIIPFVQPVNIRLLAHKRIVRTVL